MLKALLAATAISSLAVAATSSETTAQRSESASISISRGGSQPARAGSQEFFTGEVRIESQFQRDDPARVSGAIVTFEPAARTAWHSHPLGQTLIVTSGTGRVRQWGGPVQEMRQGDIVWIPPGVKHWHGATETERMIHIAIQERLAGEVVEWMGHVTDQEYAR